MNSVKCVEKESSKNILKLINDLIMGISCTHLDMGGKHKYHLPYKSFSLVSELKYALTKKIICERCDILEKIIECKNELLICYRIQKRPSEKLWNKIEKYNKMLKEISDEKCGVD